MPFVEVSYAGSNAHGRESAITSHAEQQFLPDTHAAVSAIEARCKFAILGSIALHIRIEQEQIAAADVDAPDAGAQSPAARFDLHHYGLAGLANGRLHRK